MQIRNLHFYVQKNGRTAQSAQSAAMKSSFLGQSRPPNWRDYPTKTQGHRMSNNLDRFFQNAFQADQKAIAQTPKNSFESITDDQLSAHLEVDQYETFQLTGAVRPAIDLKVKPIQGYRHDVYVDEETGGKVPVIMAAASKDKLFELFIQLVQRLGTSVDVVLESSHANTDTGHVDLYRETIDMPVLISILYEYEDLLMNDGCTGIAVLNPNTPQEIQFEEHKLLIVYGSPLEPFEFMLEKNGVTEKSDMKFITEAEHVHSSSEKFAQRFEKLRTALGLDGDQRKESYNDSFENESFGEENWGDEFGTDEDRQGGLM